jgi:hypothetical protein
MKNRPKHCGREKMLKTINIDTTEVKDRGYTKQIKNENTGKNTKFYR